MLHRIKKVSPRENMIIQAVFQNGEEKLYDMQQLCERFPQFEILQTDRALFNSVRTDVGGAGVSWNDELDLDTEEIWECGVSTGKYHNLSALQLVAVELTEARECRHMTQKRLSELTGIAQGDISRIENEKANPSVQVLQRLADGLGMKLQIRFEEK